MTAWCGWVNTDQYGGITGGCSFWNFDLNNNLSQFIGANIDSVQYRWIRKDDCWTNVLAPCRGQHKYNDYIIDNVSVGYFDNSASSFSAQAARLSTGITAARGRDGISRHRTSPGPGGGSRRWSAWRAPSRSASTTGSPAG